MSPKIPANVFRRLRIVSSASSASRRPASFASFAAVTGWVELATPAAAAAAAGDDDDAGAGVAEVVLQSSVRYSNVHQQQ